MGEGATPLLEGLAWVTSLLWDFYYFFLSLSSQFLKTCSKTKRSFLGKEK